MYQYLASAERSTANDGSFGYYSRKSSIMITVRTYGTYIYKKGKSLELKILNHNIFDNQIFTLLTLFSSFNSTF